MTAPVLAQPEPMPEVADLIPPTPAGRASYDLVVRAQQGDMVAYGQLYTLYSPTVFRFAMFRTGNRQLAEDITQDTFLRALRRIDSFVWAGRDVGAWFITIARNLVADHFKSGRYRLEISSAFYADDGYLYDRCDGTPEGNPERTVVSSLQGVAVMAAVAKLSADQRECLIWRFVRQYSVAETAQAMGKNEGAVKALQYRAVRALAGRLAATGAVAA